MSENKPHLHVEFYTEAVQNLRATREEGRPIFEDTEFVRMKIAGDPKNTFVAPANSPGGKDPETGLEFTYAERFPEHYRYFKDNLGVRVDGLPIDEMPWLTASKRAELKALNIHTVEALAGLDGALLQRIGLGARELKNQAVAWLDKAAGSADQGKFAAELAARDEQIAQLQRDIAALIAGGGAVPVPAPDEPPTVVDEEGLGDNSPFAAWDDEDIKNWIKDQSGARPAGNPSHKTLVARADTLNAELAARQQQAA